VAAIARRARSLSSSGGNNAEGEPQLTFEWPRTQPQKSNQNLWMLRRAATAIGRPHHSIASRFLVTSIQHSPLPPPNHSATLVEDPSVAFKDKSDLEIARAWLVFRLCAIKPVVDNAPQLLKLSRHVPVLSFCVFQ
jgi:hypothetical protein